MEERFYYASLSPEKYKDLLSMHCFDIIKNVIEDKDCGMQPELT